MVNAGIYAVNSNVIKMIKPNQYLDMPDLIYLNQKNMKNIIVYPVHEYWIDIGKPESLNKADYEWNELKIN